MKNFQAILRKIARKNGTTPEQVRRDIQAAIDASFDNPDPAVQAAWRDIPYKGDRPTAEEAVLGLAARVRTQGIRQ